MEESSRVEKRVARMAVLVILTTSFLIGGIATALLYRAQTETLHNQLFFAIELETAALGAELARLNNIASQITSRTRIRQELERHNRGEISTHALIDFTSPKLTDAMRSNRDVLGITRLSREMAPLLSVGSDIPASLWPRHISKYANSLGTPAKGMVVVSAPIHNRKKEIAGFDLVMFSDDRLTTTMQRFFDRIKGAGSVQIAALEEGHVQHFYDIGHTEQPLSHETLKTEIIAQLQLGLNQGLHSPDASESGKMILTHGPIGNTGWVFVFYADPWDLFAQARSQAAYAALAVLILTLLGVAFSSRITRPLVSRLSNDTRNLRRLLRRNEELLDSAKANESKLQAIIDNAPAVIYVKDRAGKYLLVNNSYERLVDRTRDRIIGSYDYELFPEDIAKSTRDTDLEVLNQGRSLELDEQAPQADGMHDYLSIKFPLLDTKGEIYGICGIASDITERRESERRLRQSATVFDCTAEAIVITDAKGTILDVNSAFTEILGYAREEVIGNNPRFWKSELHDDAFYREMWLSIRSSGQWRGEIFNRSRSGAIAPALATISTVRNAAGEAIGHVAIYTDVSQIRQSQQQLAHLAHHDALTNLPNRVLFFERLEHCLERATRHKKQVAVIFVDLDHFKHVNDSLGHSYGDQLLVGVAELLTSAVRNEDTVARIGGDEFTILIEEIRDRESLVRMIEKILRAFDREFRLADSSIHMTPSLGISLSPDDGQDAETLMRNADAAMYRAKTLGRNTYQFYTEELTQQAFDRMQMDSALRNAIPRGEFNLRYQPKIDLATGSIVGMEALLRWQNPELGEVTPEQFIPISEDNGLILPLGEWVLETTCRQAKAWLDDGLLGGNVAVNISGVQVRRGDLADVVRRTLQKTGLPAEMLELEISESFIMGESGRAIKLLRELRDLGLTLAIDDFGTGYSSLSYLKALPIQRLKIDKSFIRDIPDDKNNMAITCAIIAMARSLNLELVGEGVETETQRRFLLDEGCRFGQGYLFHHSMGADEMHQLLQAQNKRQCVS
jgi:diguanylate cyclase (GGDEF)-like protein/PAS domain S-box-containing protein